MMMMILLSSLCYALKFTLRRKLFISTLEVLDWVAGEKSFTMLVQWTFHWKYTLLLTLKFQRQLNHLTSHMVFCHRSLRFALFLFLCVFPTSFPKPIFVFHSTRGGIFHPFCDCFCFSISIYCWNVNTSGSWNSLVGNPNVHIDSLNSQCCVMVEPKFVDASVNVYVKYVVFIFFLFNLKELLREREREIEYRLKRHHIYS